MTPANYFGVSIKKNLFVKYKQMELGNLGMEPPSSIRKFVGVNSDHQPGRPSRRRVGGF